MTTARDAAALKAARLEADAVQMVTRVLRDNPKADNEPLAATIMAVLKGAGWRPTEVRPALDWRLRGGAPGALSAESRAQVLADLTAATEAHKSAGRRKPAARDGGDDRDSPDDRRLEDIWPLGWLEPVKGPDDPDGGDR